MVAVVLASAATAASAATKTFQSDPRIDAIASGIAGFPVTVTGEDDANAWVELVREGNISCPNCAGEPVGFAVIADHHVYFSPDIWDTLEGIESSGASNVIPLSAAAGAILQLTHEVYHVKLQSTDEGRVNACALQAFPTILSTYFGVAPTVTQTTTTRVRYRVKVHGRWVVRYRSVKTAATIANQAYLRFVAAAKAYYASQPPPYSTGTCS